MTLTVEEIRARWAAAFPGPWMWWAENNQSLQGHYNDQDHTPCDLQAEALLSLSSLDTDNLDRDYLHQFSEICVPNVLHLWDADGSFYEDCRMTAHISKENANAIANSPTDIAFLLAEVDRLTTELRKNRG